MQDWLAAACRTRGYEAEWLRPSRAVASEPIPPGVSPAAVIFDFGDRLDAEVIELERIVAAGGVPVIAVIGFPRVEDRGRALAAGAAAVVSKPLDVGDFCWQLEQAHSPGRCIAR